MGLLDDRKDQARRMTPLVRTALLAAAAGRVVPVYELNWFGDHYPEVGRSVEVGWAYALGEPVDAAELTRLLAVIEDQVQFYYEDDTRDDLLASVLTVVLRVLESITPDESASILATARGALTVIDAAGSAEAQVNMRTPRDKRTDSAGGEEEAWVYDAIVLAVTWLSPVRRDMFAAIGANPPAWYTDWLARRER